MSRRRTHRLLNLAAEVGPEDGDDPKEFHAKPWDAPKAAGRKAHQLCEQVKNALHSAFAACGDSLLQALTVMSVEPAPHSGRLLVIVHCDCVTRDEILGKLNAARGFLRTEVAAAICRRYAPELAFEVMA